MRLGARTRASALEALGYAKGVPPLDMEHKAFWECVVWLEDTKIRATAMASRGPLRLIEAKDWVASFAALARETGCSVDASSDSQTSLVFDHLVSTAVAPSQCRRSNAPQQLRSPWHMHLQHVRGVGLRRVPQRTHDTTT